MSETPVNVSSNMSGLPLHTADSSALAEIPAHILLVDDDPGLLVAMAALLEKLGICRP